MTDPIKPKNFILREGLDRVLAIRDRLYARLPFTAAYDRRSLKSIRDDAYAKIKEFDQLRTIDNETKQAIRPMVRSYLVEGSATWLWYNNILDALVALSISLLIVLMFVFVVAIWSWLETHSTISQFSPSFLYDPVLQALWHLGIAGLGGVIGFLVITAPLALPVHLEKRLNKRLNEAVALTQLTFSLFICECVIGIGSFVYLVTNPSLSVIDRFSEGFWAVLVGILMGNSFSILVALVTRSWIQRYSEQALFLYPRSFMVYDLVHLLFALERPATRWKRGEHVALAMRVLERVACAIEYMPRQLSPRDPISARLQQDNFRKMAAAMRNLKMWIAFPAPDTHEKFAARIARDLVSIANNTLDCLERAEPTKLPNRLPVRQRLLTLLRYMMIGLAPAALLWLAQRDPAFALVSPVLDYAKVVVLLWGLLTIVVVLDPLFSTKLSALKDIADLLPFGGKSGSNTP